MAAARSSERDAGPPTRMAEGPPPAEQGGSGLPLLAVMEIQRTLWKLENAVEHLKDTDDKHAEKLDGVVDRLHNIEKRMYAAGVVVALMTSILTLLLPKVWQLLFAAKAATP